MAMVPASIQIGDTVTVAIRQNQVQATVCTLPFI
jgi:predicted lysophospholipase L1 biosynthesis ABC-type transport system permease subunit